MIAYKINGNNVKEVECEEMEYPLNDSDGDTIYENTHFATPKEAYKQAIRNCEAGISIFTRCVKEAREKVRESEIKLADECIDLEQLIKEFKSLED